MQPSLAELFRELHNSSLLGREAAEAGVYEMSMGHMRAVMGIAGKLFTRLGVLQEFAEDAKFVAEVDRALVREKQSPPVRIPGEVPLPLSPGPGGKPPRPRKGKG